RHDVAFVKCTLARIIVCHSLKCQIVFKTSPIILNSLMTRRFSKMKHSNDYAIVRTTDSLRSLLRLAQGGCNQGRTAWTRWVVKRGKNNKGRPLLVHLRRSGSSPSGNAAHPHARFPHVGR